MAGDGTEYGAQTGRGLCRGSITDRFTLSRTLSTTATWCRCKLRATLRNHNGEHLLDRSCSEDMGGVCLMSGDSDSGTVGEPDNG